MTDVICERSIPITIPLTREIRAITIVSNNIIERTFLFSIPNI